MVAGDWQKAKNYQELKIDHVMLAGGCMCIFEKI